MVRIAITILFLCINVYSFGQNNITECVTQKALSFEGIKETLGYNDSPEIRIFIDALDKPVPYGSSWCAAFVSYCLRSCGVDKPNSAWSPSLFVGKNVYGYEYIQSNKLKKGDIFGLYYTRLGRIAHVGFVLEDRGFSVLTIEGNTGGSGGRDGDGVYKKVRLRKQLSKIKRYE